jgi:hypothetical protein
MKGTLRTAAFGAIYPETAHFRRFRSLGIGTKSARQIRTASRTIAAAKGSMNTTTIGADG